MMKIDDFLKQTLNAYYIHTVENFVTNLQKLTELNFIPNRSKTKPEFVLVLIRIRIRDSSFEPELKPGNFELLSGRDYNLRDYNSKFSQDKKIRINEKTECYNLQLWKFRHDRSEFPKPESGLESKYEPEERIRCNFRFGSVVTNIRILRSICLMLNYLIYGLCKIFLINHDSSFFCS